MLSFRSVIPSYSIHYTKLYDYDQVKTALSGFSLFEFGGIEPNPHYRITSYNVCYTKLLRTKISLQVLAFLLTAVALYFILPGEPKFKYEYQKGFPWRHDNLVAPFDFAILKSPAEIEEEKEEQANSVIPYFIFDTSNYSSALDQLKEDINLTFDSSEEERKLVLNKLKIKLEDLYFTGIV